MTRTQRERLKKFIGEKVIVEVKDTYDTFHDDDTDHCGRDYNLVGTLLEVREDAIKIFFRSDTSGENIERTISFYKKEKTHLSEFGEEIIQITLEDPVIFVA